MEVGDRVSYSRGLPSITTRYYRDEKFIAKLAEQIQSFIYDLNAMVEKYKI